MFRDSPTLPLTLPETRAQIAGELQILRPGRNCWRIERANRAAFLVHGCAYFAALGAALRRAQRSVLLLGWDFDPKTCLDPRAATAEAPGRFQDLLHALVAERPDLRVDILIWDATVLFRPGQKLPSLFDTPVDAPERITLRYDGNVPPGASHHDKLVVIDDAIAFAGGIDIVGHRWDTAAHCCPDPLRRRPSGEPYGPIHDIMMAVDGEAAAGLGELARMRWLQATGTVLPPAGPGFDPWPPDLAPDVRDVAVGIARTLPKLNGNAPVQEVAALNDDALGAARDWIYIETQYLASSRIGDLLVRLLERPEPPEIVIVVRYQSNGWIEELVMGSNRDRLLRRLRAADRRGRLRVFHPVLDAPEDSPDRHLNVHAKLVMVDGRFIRIGSSNLNNRSLGLDTECDLAIEAETPETAEAITALRNRLLAEHLDTTEAAVAAAVARCGGLIPAIESLNVKPRGLRRFAAEDRDGPAEPITGTAVLDPEEPIDLDMLRRAILPI